MYVPQHFASTDAEQLRQLMSAAPLATLVVVTDSGLVVNHVPLLWCSGYGEHGSLRGHVARANPVWRLALSPVTAVAIFHGPQHYVSPSWYPSKAVDPKVVPTWNYSVVHAHGRLSAHDDKEWVRGLVGELTVAHESTRAKAWQVSDAPADYLEKNLAAIVGIELEITGLSGKLKHSQNRSVADQRGVIAGLDEEAGGAALAEWMRRGVGSRGG